METNINDHPSKVSYRQSTPLKNQISKYFYIYLPIAIFPFSVCVLRLMKKSMLSWFIYKAVKNRILCAYMNVHLGKECYM